MNIFEEAAQEESRQGRGKATRAKSDSTKATKAKTTSTKAKSTSTKAKGTKAKAKKCSGGHNDAGRTVTDTMMPMMGLGLGMAMMDGLFD